MNVRFTTMVKHNRLAFSPGPVYALEGEYAAAAGAYFIAMGWAAETTDPVDFTIGGDDLYVNPETTFADGPNKGQRVLPEA